VVESVIHPVPVCKGSRIRFIEVINGKLNSTSNWEGWLLVVGSVPSCSRIYRRDSMRRIKTEKQDQEKQEERDEYFASRAREASI
jgi:hypothetical protein